MLEAMLSGRYELETDKCGNVFIDRDGEMFAHVLTYIKVGSLPKTGNVFFLRQLRREFAYYAIDVTFTAKHLLVIGGVGRNIDPLKSAEMCDISDTYLQSSKWEALGEIPSATYALTVTFLPGIGTVVSTGGLISCVTSLDRATAVSLVYEYSPSSGLWNRLESMRVARFSHGACVLGDSLFVVGGCSNTEQNPIFLSTVERYDLYGRTWSPVLDMPSPRAYCGVCQLHGEMYVLGGLQEGGELFDSVLKFDPIACAWSKAAALHQARRSLGVCVSDGFIYAGGGLDAANNYSSTFEKYDPESNSWTLLPDLPCPRAGLILVQAEGIIFAIGGSSDEDIAVGDVDCFDCATNTWKNASDSASPLLIPRSVAGGCLVEDTINYFESKLSNPKGTRDTFHTDEIATFHHLS